MVLNTRPRDQTAAAQSAADEAGFESVEAPAIEVVPAWSFAELESARRELRAGAFDWVDSAEPERRRLPAPTT